MALNIKDEATDRVARELARETGEPITTATRIALQERLERVRERRVRRADHDQLGSIIARGRARPGRDDRSADDIVGYDDVGLPT